MTKGINIIQEKIDQAVRQRREHLERYCAAFIAQVGSAEASQYELIEEHPSDPLKGFAIRWYFRKRLPEEKQSEKKE